MKINLLNNINNYKNYTSNINNTKAAHKSFSSNPLKPLAQDTVSFSSKAKFQQDVPQSIQKGVEIGKQIYAELAKNPQGTDLLDVVAQTDSRLKVLPITELNEDGYTAYYRKDILLDGTPANQTMYINDNTSDIKDDTSALVRAMEIAHEYTHFAQDDDGLEGKIIGSMSDDPRYTNTVAYMSNELFKYFDSDLQVAVVSPVFNNYQDREAMEKYRKVIPSKRNISQEDLIKASPLRNKEDFNLFVSKKFDAEYNSFKQSLEGLTAPFAVMMREVIEEEESKGQSETFKNNLKKAMEIQAHNEKEAYTTEANVARDYMKTRKSLNLDAFPAYYEMLETALKTED